MPIREIKSLAEAKKAAEVQFVSRRDAYKEVLPSQFLNAKPITAYEERWTKMIQAAIDGKNICLVAEDGDKFVGVSASGPALDDDLDKRLVGELYVIYILPEYKGKGLGKQLFDKTTQELKNKGFSKIAVWVYENNSAARAFYEARGLTPDGARRQPEGVDVQVIRQAMELS